MCACAVECVEGVECVPVVWKVSQSLPKVCPRCEVMCSWEIFGALPSMTSLTSEQPSTSEPPSRSEQPSSSERPPSSRLTT
eukprot:15954-Chlamydomonas_euryale.AAC.1